MVVTAWVAGQLVGFFTFTHVSEGEFYTVEVDDDAVGELAALFEVDVL